MSNYGLKRNSDEKFYTKMNIAQTCISYFKKRLNLPFTLELLNPGAGNGSFSNVLKDMFKNLTAVDIHKELDYIIPEGLSNI